jgi:hypothetical protein
MTRYSLFSCSEALLFLQNAQKWPSNKAEVKLKPEA